MDRKKMGEQCYLLIDSIKELVSDGLWSEVSNEYVEKYYLLLNKCYEDLQKVKKGDGVNKN